MTTSTNYSGRTVDLSLFPGASSPGIPVIAQISTRPKAVAGLSKMAQNFARILMTPLGTYRGSPLMGSYFFTKLVSRLVRYPSDISQVFLVERDRVTEYMRSNFSATLTADERIKTARLKEVVVDATSIYLRIEVESEAGGTLPFLLPVNWNT